MEGVGKLYKLRIKPERTQDLVQPAQFLFSRAPAAVNHQRASGDHGAFVRSKIEGGGGDFFGFGHSPVELC